MKLLITSASALISESINNFIPGIIESLDGFLALSSENKVVVVSIHKNSILNIPHRFNPIQIKAKYRGSPLLVEFLKETLKFEAQDVIVLGSKDVDLYVASNSKSLLLRAEYARPHRSTDKLYLLEYGIPIKDPIALTQFFSHFTNIINPWYYKLQIDSRSIVYALTKANTMGGVNATQKQLNEKFKRCLKANDVTHRMQFLIYFMVSTYTILKDLKKINYWGIYPSSQSSNNDDLEFFKEKARQAYNCKTKKQLFIRTKVTVKRSEKSKSSRLKIGCDSELSTIIINPYYKNKIKGKCVCVIDDFSTLGTSSETARTLLTSAGVLEIVFIALGKFGDEYHKYSYAIRGDVYDSFTFTKNGSSQMTGTLNNGANFEFIESLADML